MSEFSKKYTPKEFEQTIYQDWEKNNLFVPSDSNNEKTFYIPMPPPNVTWVLHLGHALTLTLEDIMTRFHRMKGESTLWVPGTDHAGIATQAKVEQLLYSQWLTRQKLGREKFTDQIWEWKKHHGNIITNQIRKMWASCDWNQETFTLDKNPAAAVRDAFVDLYNKGMIYKGEYMVNYSPALQTVISDQEIDYREEKTKMYYITYFVSGSDNEIVIATTRPETLLWDVAVAVHPKDKRYKNLVKNKKQLILPILNKTIPIIWDEMVDMNFGSGAVKITPAHDPADFETAKRHWLPLDHIVIDKDGMLTKKAEIFVGQHYEMARENIVELLRAKGNLVREEPYTHKVGYCSRSGCKIDTIISTQWFVKVAPMVAKVMKGYEKKDFEIIPSRFNKIFEDWMENMHDWCISRQLWWGHRIPAYYHKDTGEMVVTSEDLSKDSNYVQDEDVLDTWFSSALWPMSVLDYDFQAEKQSELFQKFYPAQMLETGHDIIFFWVIRMLLFWYEFTKQTPFKKIYFHGLVKDKNGAKMSKSLGNGIDPLDMIEKYSTDALRLTLSIGNTPGNDLKFDEENVRENTLFLNKLWNATRFVYMNLFEKNAYTLSTLEHLEEKLLGVYDQLAFHEKWILSRLKATSDAINEGMKKYTFSEAGIQLQNFTKNEFCDYYIEEYKVTRETSPYGHDVIIYVIANILKLWHPYIPFITEELWKSIGFSGYLITTSFSQVPFERDKILENKKQRIIEVIKEIRIIRNTNNIPTNVAVEVFLKVKKKGNDLFSDDMIHIISGIVNSKATHRVLQTPEHPNLSYGVTKTGIELYVDTSGGKDRSQEISYIKEQINDTQDYLHKINAKLMNDSFVRNAPADIVRSEMDKKLQAIDRLEKLKEKLTTLEK